MDALDPLACVSWLGPILGLVAARGPSGGGELRRDPAALDLLRRSKDLLYKPADQGLRILRALFRARIGGHPRLHGTVEIAGAMIWRANEGLAVRIGEGEGNARLALNLLKSLVEFLRGGSSLMGDFPGDGLALEGERRITVTPGPKSMLAENAVALGWDRVDGCTIEFDARGLPVRHVTVGERGAAGRKANAPSEISVATEWEAAGSRFVFRRVTVTMTAVEGKERKPATFPFRRLTTSWEFREERGITVPFRFENRLEPEEGVEGGLATRIDELHLDRIEVNPKLTAEDRRSFASVDEMERREETATLLEIGSPAPDWELASPEGRKVRLSELRGHVVVLDFFATWCQPCLDAIPLLQRIHERFADEPVRVLGISCWEEQLGAPNPSDPAALWRERGLGYGLLLDGNAVADRYGVTALPTLYVIDAEGVLAHVHLGFDESMEEHLAAVVRNAIP